MAFKFHKGRSQVIDYTPTGAVTGGDAVVVGDNVFFAKSDIAANVLGALDIGGVWTGPKATTAGTGWLKGAKLYYDGATGLLTKTAGALKCVGIAVADAADADATADVFSIPNVGDVRLDGDVSQQAHIADQAAATYAAPTNNSSAVTDSTTGVASATHTLVAPAGADYVKAELEANFATLAAEYNALRTALGSAITQLAALAVDAGAGRTKVNAILASLEAAGVLAAE